MSLPIDAEALYVALRDGVRPLLVPGAALVGIWSGGAWLAERLQRDLGLAGGHGVISSMLHRDDFGSRGLAAGAEPTRLPFEIDGRPIVLIDDVLATGRTIRAASQAPPDQMPTRAVCGASASSPRTPWRKAA